MRTRGGVGTRFRGEWLALAGLGLVFVFGVGLTREVARRRALNSEIAVLQHEASSLGERRDELQRLIADYQRPSTQEAEARLKLNLGKPGERSLIIERQPSAPAQSPVADAAPASIPARWWRYFFGA